MGRDTRDGGERGGGRERERESPDDLLGASMRCRAFFLSRNIEDVEVRGVTESGVVWERRVGLCSGRWETGWSCEVHTENVKGVEHT